MPPIAELLVTVKKGGVYHPPGTALDLTADEAESLRGQVRILPDVVAVPTAKPLPVIEEADAPSSAAPPSDGASRVEEIAAAFDLLTPEDFNQSGRPKVAPLADVLGYKPTQGEIDGAILFRDDQARQA